MPDADVAMKGGSGSERARVCRMWVRRCRASCLLYGVRERKRKRVVVGLEPDEATLVEADCCSGR